MCIIQDLFLLIVLMHGFKSIPNNWDGKLFASLLIQLNLNMYN